LYAEQDNKIAPEKQKHSLTEFVFKDRRLEQLLLEQDINPLEPFTKLNFVSQDGRA
jgi:hypothetical protein